MLDSYLTDTALLLNDPENQFYTTGTLTTLINRARRWISIRTLYPRLLVTTINTVAGQEAYPLTLANGAVSGTAGLAAPYGLVGLSSQEANYFPALGRSDFPSFQADWRILNNTLQNYPYKFSTYGRGSGSIVYLAPTPAAAYEMWWDVACTPANLATDSDPEAIPLPWTEVVPFAAARLAVITQQRWADMTGFKQEVDAMLMEASAAETPFIRPDWYPTER